MVENTESIAQENGQDLSPIFREAEAAWLDLMAAEQRIQAAATALKSTPESVAGYGIERALLKHKMHLAPAHLENLRSHITDRLNKEQSDGQSSQGA